MPGEWVFWLTSQDDRSGDYRPAGWARGHAGAARSAMVVVTPPPRERGGFSLTLAGVADDQPDPLDVQRADHVRVRGVPADHADEVGLGEAVLLREVPAPGGGTRAGGVGG